MTAVSGSCWKAFTWRIAWNRAISRILVCATSIMHEAEHTLSFLPCQSICATGCLRLLHLLPPAAGGDAPSRRVHRVGHGALS